MSREIYGQAMELLEFDKVAAQIAAYGACSLGKERILQMTPYASIDEANHELSGVDEAVRELYRIGPLPFGGITDIRPHLARANIGGILSSQSLLAVADFIYGGRRVRQTLLNLDKSLNYSLLTEMGERLYDARHVEEDLRKAITDEGTVHDGASPRLRQLRQERRQAEERIRQVLDEMIRTHHRMLQEPVVAMRGNSLCLPIRVEHKHQIRGVIHDYSASGATVFIEPEAVVETGRKIQTIQLEEEQEIERILRRLSGIVAGVSENLEDNSGILGILDAWFAKAQFAKKQGCEKPVLTGNQVWELRRARHPLIDRNQAVPVDLTLGKDYSMVVITGPNTGGKTVSLKTVGLLTLIAMSGCFVPAAEGSQVAWCDGVYIDVGDEQSIEQSLSTFSSHMKKIISILNNATSTSLVLLDELGAGTDPAEGAALAIAILDEFHARGCTVMATTHYAELKAYAFASEYAVNASVEFNVETLHPTYRLLVGIPGRSNALAIARRLGLPEFIINEARSQIQGGDIRVEDLIQQMEKARREADEAKTAVINERETAEKLKSEWELKWNALQEKERSLLEQANAKATAIVQHAEEQADRIIKELRKRQRGPVKDHELVELRKGLESALPKQFERSRRSVGGAGPLEVGAKVRVVNLNQQGEVLQISSNGKDLMVQLGALKTKVKSKDVEVLASAKSEAASGMAFSRKSMPKSIPLQMDVRGMTVDEALPVIDKYLDDAAVAHVARVTVIHGKGTGALRDGVRRHLSGQKEVKSWHPGGPGDGGDGATVVDILF